MKAVAASRRKFLRLLGAAPVAGPVAAREIAAKAGITGIIGSSAYWAVPEGVPVGDVSASSAKLGESWVARALREFYSPTSVRHREERSRMMARTLDPDIASLRSVSVGAAYEMQYRRCLERVTRQERSNLLDYAEREAREKIGLSS